jgi:hypothetical protein
MTARNPVWYGKAHRYKEGFAGHRCSGKFSFHCLRCPLSKKDAGGRSGRFVLGRSAAGVHIRRRAVPLRQKGRQTHGGTRGLLTIGLLPAADPLLLSLG